jgi:serine protease AprX
MMTVIKYWVRRIVFLLFGLRLMFTVHGQDNLLIFFSDKAGTTFSPYEYFDQKALDRRLRAGLDLYDSTDFPVKQEYIDAVTKISGPVLGELRWFNAVFTTADHSQYLQIKQLPFVKSIIRDEVRVPEICIVKDTVFKADELKLLEFQIERMQGSLFHQKGLTGKGIRIAVLDAGFPGVDKNPAFGHLWKNKQIISSWDFTKKRMDVFLGNPHGTMVLSCIAGKWANRKMGLAPDAEILLARTQIERVSAVAELYWLQAVEWADKNGADIISSSLAYTYERYHTFEMNGKTSLVAKAANLAANKGMLVINAMGNDGQKDWKILATPADADSVISVGAINPFTDFHAGFSSFGPTSDYRMKPNVVAPGKVLVANKVKTQKEQGTSFAAPLVSGFAACAWQNKPFLTNMQLFEEIEKSGHLYPYYDYAHGYGVPQASYFLDMGKGLSTPTFDFSLRNDTIFIEVFPDFIEKKFLKSNNYLYYHIENEQGFLQNYWLIDVFAKKAAFISLKQFPDGKKLRAHYKGYTKEYILN